MCFHASERESSLRIVKTINFQDIVEDLAFCIQTFSEEIAENGGAEQGSHDADFEAAEVHARKPVRRRQNEAAEDERTGQQRSVIRADEPPRNMRNHEADKRHNPRHRNRSRREQRTRQYHPNFERFGIEAEMRRAFFAECHEIEFAGG